MKIEELAHMLGKTLEVNWSESSKDFYSSISGLETLDGEFLTSSAGNGDSPESAKKAYGRILAGKRIVINAYGDNRFELEIPESMEEDE